MRILLIISCLFVTQINAQTGLGLEYQRNIECIGLTDFEDLLLSNSSFLLTKPKGSYRHAYGLEIQEAIIGQFGGFYVFGLTSDIDFKLNKFPVSFNLNGFIGGGGGASAQHPQQHTNVGPEANCPLPAARLLTDADNKSIMMRGFAHL